jgi:hypothetical protein
MSIQLDQLTVKFLIDIMQDDINGLEIRYKDEMRFHRILKIISGWSKMTTALYPRIYFPTKNTDSPKNRLRILQHEWIHLRDAQTFFGQLPKKMKWINVPLWYICYLFPQILVLSALATPILALLGNPWSLLGLLGLVFVLPIPAPFRMLSELRAYRHDVFVGRPIDDVIDNFVSFKYWYMWPFKKQLRKLLLKTPPYHAIMVRSVAYAKDLAEKEILAGAN